MQYRVLSHTADTGIEAAAATLGELIEALSAGMFALMAAFDSCPGEREATVAVVAETPEDLVVDMLAELLYRSEVDGVVFCEFAASQPSPDEVVVTARGVDAAAVDLSGPPIKAVTYHDLVVTRDDGEWYGRVYFDV